MSGSFIRSLIDSGIDPEEVEKLKKTVKPVKEGEVLIRLITIPNKSVLSEASSMTSLQEVMDANRSRREKE